jgi:hypothetical protein
MPKKIGYGIAAFVSQYRVQTIKVDFAFALDLRSGKQTHISEEGLCFQSRSLLKARQNIS